MFKFGLTYFLAFCANSNNYHRPIVLDWHWYRLSVCLVLKML